MTRLTRIVAGTAIGWALVAQAAVAQTAGGRASNAQDAEALGLEEIVVTAQKRAESLQETPLAVSAITTEAIEARGITDVSNLTAVAPNLAVTTAPASSTNTTVFIRGVGLGDPILTADAPVALYLDGIVLGRSSGAVFDLVDLERIEVLRGPQGTLYGRNTIGGAVNFITAKPADEFGVKQKFSYGSFDQWQSRTTLDTGEFGDSGLRAKLSYVHREQDGYVDDLLAPDNRDPGAFNLDAFRAAIGWNGGGLRADYAFDFNHRESIAPFFQMTVARPDVVAYLQNSPALGGQAPLISTKRLDTVRADDDGLLTDKVWGHTLTLEADLNDDTTLRSLTGYRKWKNTDRGDELDGQGGILGLTVSPILLAGGPFTPTGVQPISLFASTNERRQHQWSQEVNLIGKAGEAIDYVAGLFYFEEKSSERNPQFPTIVITPLFAIPIQTLLDYTHKSTSKAAFAQATYHLSDQLSATGGIRYTEDKRRLEQTSAFPRSLKANFDRLNWTASLDYDVNDDVLVYGRIATGYKSGGFNARSPGNAAFDPEDMTSYELGFKSELFERRLRLNVTGFYSSREDLQIDQFQSGSGGSTSVTVNAGKAVYKGIEAEGEALLADGLTLSGSLGYVDREYKEFLIRDPATNEIVDVADTARFTYASKITWTAAAQYQLPRFDFGTLSARLEYNYRGRIYFFPTLFGTPFRDEIAGGSRGLLDARVTLADLRLGGVEAAVALWGRNLTKEEYRVHGIDFGALGYAGSVYGEPRSFGIDFNIAF